MKKTFQGTIDDMVESHLRLAELSGALQKIKWLGLAVVPAVFIIVFVMQGSLVTTLIIGSVSAAALAVHHLTTYKKTYRKRIYKSLVKACGTDQPGSCEYALDDKGLVFRARGEELRFAWQNATQVLDTEDAIEVIMQPTAIARIPKRIFKDAGELQEWRACIKRHIHDGPSRQDA